MFDRLACLAFFLVSTNTGLVFSLLSVTTVSLATEVVVTERKENIKPVLFFNKGPKSLLIYNCYSLIVHSLINYIQNKDPKCYLKHIKHKQLQQNISMKNEVVNIP